MNNQTCEMCKSKEASVLYKRKVGKYIVEYYRCDTCGDTGIQGNVIKDNLKIKDHVVSEVVKQLSQLKPIYHDPTKKDDQLSKLESSWVIVNMIGYGNYEGKLIGHTPFAVYVESKGELYPKLIWLTEVKDIFVFKSKKDFDKEMQNRKEQLDRAAQKAEEFEQQSLEEELAGEHHGK